jgi:anti-sigma B factor antagonist
MEFHYHETDRDVLILNADRELDSWVSGRSIEDLQRVIDAGARKLAIDCSRLGYVSSIGIATLIRLYKRVVEHGGHMKLVGVQPPLARLLEITRLKQVFQVYPTLDEALRAFRTETLPPPPDRSSFTVDR